MLIDGPHGFPFPELEYFFFYPHLKTNGLLVVDDIHIPTIGRLADFISEDRMFEKVEFIGATAVFRRTDAPVFDPFGDGWWFQDYNRRRADFAKDFLLHDGKRREPISFEGNSEPIGRRRRSRGGGPPIRPSQPRQAQAARRQHVRKARREQKSQFLLAREGHGIEPA